MQRTDKFIDLLELLEPFSNDLDPFGETGALDIRSLLDFLWNKYLSRDNWPKYQSPERCGTTPPRYASILSFAGLDREDVLLYPLLAHEIGHFLDLSQNTPICNDPTVRQQASLPTLANIEEIVKKFDQSRKASDVYRWVNEQINVCLREITADILAARMMGIAYFFARNSSALCNVWAG